MVDVIFLSKTIPGVNYVMKCKKRPNIKEISVVLCFFSFLCSEEYVLIVGVQVVF